jgi:hypothetical protein
MWTTCFLDIQVSLVIQVLVLGMHISPWLDHLHVFRCDANAGSQSLTQVTDPDMMYTINTLHVTSGRNASNTKSPQHNSLQYTDTVENHNVASLHQQRFGRVKSQQRFSFMQVPGLGPD